MQDAADDTPVFVPTIIEGESSAGHKASAHPSHSAAVAAARAVFDGRIPNPSDLVEYARGQEMLAVELGQEQEPESAPALRDLHADLHQVCRCS